MHSVILGRGSSPASTTWYPRMGPDEEIQRAVGVNVTQERNIKGRGAERKLERLSQTWHASSNGPLPHCLCPRGQRPQWAPETEPLRGTHFLKTLEGPRKWIEGIISSFHKNKAPWFSNFSIVVTQRVVQTQITGPHLQSVQFRRSGAGPNNFHFLFSGRADAIDPETIFWESLP